MARLVTQRHIAGEEENRAHEERGVALLTMVFCSALFMLLGLSLTFSSMTEFKMSTEYEAREQALFIADAGFNLTQVILRGNDLSDLLSTVTQVNQYLNFPVPTQRTALEYFDRNPLSSVEAIHLSSASLNWQSLSDLGLWLLAVLPLFVAGILSSLKCGELASMLVIGGGAGGSGLMGAAMAAASGGKAAIAAESTGALKK